MATHYYRTGNLSYEKRLSYGNLTAREDREDLK